VDVRATLNRVCGSPNETNWPGIGKLPEYVKIVPQFRGCGLAMHLLAHMPKTKLPPPASFPSSFSASYLTPSIATTLTAPTLASSVVSSSFPSSSSSSASSERGEIPIDPLALDLLERLLLYSPDQRITAVQALNHPYFKGVDSTTLLTLFT
jgi:serine/threonine protein kinase